MRLHLLSSLSALVLGLGLTGCGDDGGGTAVDARTLDADPTAINGCTPATAMDLTAAGASRQIVTVGNSYSPHCVRIKVGQSVTWTADFQVHPLSSGTPAGGPQAGSPITTTTSGNSKMFTFPAAGNFGFWCQVHTTLMMGAVYVEP